jgi:Fur family ferric uptake transcriptional regulator
VKEHRTTKQSQLILEVVQAHHDHPTADQIYLEVRAIDNRISRGTVYRNLDKLADMGDILHVKVPGADRFDSRLGYHYHMVCKECGAVTDAPIDYQNEIDEQVLEKAGFHVERHRTVFEGLCQKCMRNHQD